MSDLFRKISKTFRKMRGRSIPADSTDRRRAPRFICSLPVIWEVGRNQGEAELREVSSTGIKIWSHQAILAGKHIRVRPVESLDAPPLTVDVAIGTVVYSRARGSGFEVGVELINPERISRYAWIGQLSSQNDSPSPMPAAVVQAGVPKLSLVTNRSEVGHFDRGLLRSQFVLPQVEKNSKNKDTK